MRIAAIMTCFNRQQKTLTCLESFFRIVKDAEVYLTDDGCTDGTSNAVKERFHNKVRIIQGTGNLFWSRGMWTAWKEAVKGHYDYYLWLNDDVVLYSDFFQELLVCLEIVGEKSIISGLIENQNKTEILYGGTDKNKQLITVSETPQPIKYMNGNVVLVPKCVVDEIGIIDPVLHHDLGDVDYGLTAQEHGIKVYATRKPVAYGYKNDFCRVRKNGVSLVQRFKVLNTPLGSPLSINFYYRKKHFGLIAALAFNAKIVIINIFPDILVKRLFGNKYD